jgi:hypothetical protein
MAEETDQTKGTQDKTPGSEAQDKIHDQLESLQQSVQNTEQMGQLLADPQVRAYLEAKQQGIQGKFEMPEGNGQGTKIAERVPDEPSDWEELSNKELGDHITQSVLSRMGTVMDKHLSGLSQSVAGVEQYIKNSETVRSQEEVTRLRGKFKDFDKFRDPMVEIDTQVNGKLPFEELYGLAKLRAGSPIEPDKSFESERPDSGPARLAKRVKPEDEKGPKLQGRKGFLQMLEQVDHSALSV